MIDGGPTPTWPPEQVRAWIDRHGGNLSACARRLRVHRTELQGWVADPDQSSSARSLPPRVQGHMESLDAHEPGPIRSG